MRPLTFNALHALSSFWGFFNFFFSWSFSLTAQVLPMRQSCCFYSFPVNGTDNSSCHQTADRRLATCQTGILATRPLASWLDGGGMWGGGGVGLTRSLSASGAHCRHVGTCCPAIEPCGI